MLVLPVTASAVRVAIRQLDNELGRRRFNVISARLCGTRRQVGTKMLADKLDRKQKLQDRHSPDGASIR